MIFTIPVTISVTLDDGSPDPEPGDPLAERMRDAAEEAIRTALEHEDANFSCEIDPIATVRVEAIGATLT